MKHIFWVLILLIILSWLGVFFSRESTPVLPYSLEVKENTEDLTLQANAYIAVFIDTEGNTITLAEKNADTPLPIASITKLFTAFSAKYLIAENTKITMTEEATRERGNFLTKWGDTLTRDVAIRTMLVESNNDIAALLHLVSNKNLVSFANNFAREQGLTSIALVNPTGLDPLSGGRPNEASPRDLASFGAYLLDQEQDIVSYTRVPLYDVVDSEGVLLYRATSTNKLLGNPLNPFVILGGKTGETPRAGKNLLLIVSAPEETGAIVSVVLGSPDHFLDTQKLLSWVNESYSWKIK